MVSFTTVVALDARHLDQFRMVWPTWQRLKPEIVASPLLLICDAFAGGPRYWRRELSWLDHAQRKMALWDWPNADDSENAGMTQRERMLTAFVHLPHRLVETPYWLKLDVDVVATAAEKWIFPNWFSKNPAVVASPWGYTKPATWIHDLQRWAQNVPALADLEEPTMHPRPGSATYRHPRWCSWLAFVNTAWSRFVASFAPGRLPVPSQDTYHWYVALRRGDLVVTAKMKRFGWASISSNRRRAELVRQVLAGKSS
jgi:hypothetical protein